MTTKKNFGKRILSLALVFLLVLSLIPTSVMAADTDQPWLDSSVTATKDGITLYIPEVYCDDCGENVQDAELVIDSVDYAVGTLRVKYHLGRHFCFEISTKSNTISIDNFDCTTEYNEYPVYANAWDQTTTEPVAYLSREAGHIFDEGESNICTFCGEMVQTGWVYDSGNWYYYYEDGTMATDAIITNENGSYYVGSDGVMVVNQKVLVDDVWYQAAEDGTLEPLGFDNRWDLDSDNWYYYYEDGTMATNVVISNENGSYYFGSDGALVVNQKVQIDGVWYQAAEDGRLEPLEIDTHNYVNGCCTDCDAFEPATDENEDGVFEISNAGQLYWFAQYVNKGNTSARAVLTQDLVINEGVMSADSENARVWIPIGNNNNRFQGTFDGINNTVSGLYFNDSEAVDVGLFGVVGENGTVKNTGVINSYFNGDTNIGSLVGYSKGTITNCYSTGAVSGGSSIGGVVGANQSGVVANCYNKGIISGTRDFIGGVVGTNQSGVVANCYNTGNVSGTVSSVGGVVGDNYEGEISNSYNTGSVDGGLWIGGVAGNSDGTIANCYNTGAVSGTGSRIGGVIGRNYGTTTNCYYLDTAYNGGIDGKNVAGSAEAKTAEQFASGEVAYLLQGERTDKIWGQKIGTDSYPVFGGDKVYRVENCSGAPAYSNTNENIDHNFEKGFCTICGDIDGIAQVKGYSIGLGSNIAVNYYMVFSDEVLSDENAKMVFIVPDTDSTYTVEIPVNNVTPNDDGCYVFTCEVAAKEMTSAIKAKLVTSESELRLDDYTVQQYAEVILSDTAKYAKEQKLVKAMLNYGANAQLYFNYNTDNLANDTEYMTKDEKVTELYGFAGAPFTLEGEESGIKYYGTALSLETELMFKHYFIVDESVDTQSLEITCDYPVTLKKNGSFYELIISDIPAHKMGENSFKVAIGGITLDYTIYSYGALAQNSGKEELWTVVSALAHFAGEATMYAYK